MNARTAKLFGRYTRRFGHSKKRLIEVWRQLNYRQRLTARRLMITRLNDPKLGTHFEEGVK